MNNEGPVNVDAKLAMNKFSVDKSSPHIILASAPDRERFFVLLNACPAGLFKLDASGNIHFDYAGCLECGTCQLLVGNAVLEKWQYPRGASGVTLRYG
ncbi:ferredoxin [Dickeya fangzhongdai]|uniref:ferredoxin n=1 Tax=Dickeya fangzhongdai TaxID=1778540 RepID=UPI00057E2B2A|nr:ferredoxin [Dickeya fangzhongdai]